MTANNTLRILLHKSEKEKIEDSHKNNEDIHRHDDKQ